MLGAFAFRNARSNGTGEIFLPIERTLNGTEWIKYESWNGTERFFSSNVNYERRSFIIQEETCLFSQSVSIIVFFYLKIQFLFDLNFKILFAKRS